MTEENTSSEQPHDYMSDYEELKRRGLIGNQSRREPLMSRADVLTTAAAVLVPTVVVLVLLAIA